MKIKQKSKFEKIIGSWWWPWSNKTLPNRTLYHRSTTITPYKFSSSSSSTESSIQLINSTLSKNSIKVSNSSSTTTTTHTYLTDISNFSNRNLIEYENSTVPSSTSTESITNSINHANSNSMVDRERDNDSFIIDYIYDEILSTTSQNLQSSIEKNRTSSIPVPTSTRYEENQCSYGIGNCLTDIYDKFNLSELIMYNESSTLNLNNFINTTTTSNQSDIQTNFNNLMNNSLGEIVIGGVSNYINLNDKSNFIIFGLNDSFINNSDLMTMNSSDVFAQRVPHNQSGINVIDRDTLEIETTIQLIAMISTTVMLAFIILATVIGNVFVIAAILLERHLQSVANYLILSLAVADLLVACLVMPLGAVYEVSQEWRMGPELCDMWTSSDVLCCTASILHLVCIALDRYWAVTNIDYVHQRTARRIGIMILVVWGLSFLVSIAPLLGWKDPNWNNRINNLQCIVSQDIGYQIFATVASFYFPLLVILVLYWRIYQTARKRIRRRQQVSGAQQMPPGGIIASAAGGSGGIAAAVVAVIGRPLPTISETTTAFTNVSSANTSPEKGSIGNGVDRIECDLPTADLSVGYPSHSGPSLLRPSIITRKKTQNSADSKRERKAAKTLAIITGAFVCCWLPFFIVAILLPTCSSCDVSPLLISFFLWLGYFNSTLNPIIYTIFSPEFRHAFKRILCGRRNSIRRRTRHMGVRR